MNKLIVFQIIMADCPENEGGKMITVFERSKKILTRTVTAKAEDKAIRDDNFISPAGRTIIFILIF